MIFPDWTLFNIIFYISWGLFALSFGFLAYYNIMALGYSKFSSGKGIPSRIGMVIIYSLPILIVTLCALPYLPYLRLIQLAVYGALVIHFGKRVLESLLIHKYSGHMDVLAVVVASITYTFMAGGISGLNIQPASEMGGIFYAGLVLFFVGEMGNFYHHLLLANLRKADREYHIPHGGWFEYVACPHYFFELLAWLGIALLSRHLFAMLVFVSMSAYLISRSIKTRQWYQQRFKQEYPAKRKLLIPFIF